MAAKNCGKILDGHTLIVKCTVAYEYQLANSLDRALACAKKICTDLDTRYKINMVTNGKDQFIGMACVRVEDMRVYNMLLGKNPDGSIRTKDVLDETWIAPTQEEIDEVERQVSLVDEPELVENMCWGLFDHLYGVYVEKINSLRRRLHQQTLTIQLPSLMQLDPYETDEDQKLKYKVRQTEKNKDNKEFDITTFVSPNHLTFEVNPAFITKPAGEFIPHILKCTKLPHSITPTQLKQIFSPYASDNKTQYHWILNGIHTDESYPFVHIDQNRTATVYFDSHTYNASSALFFTKKMKLEAKNVWFTHCFVSDRDVSKDVTKMPRPYPSKTHFLQQRPNNQTGSQQNTGTQPRQSSQQKSVGAHTTNPQRTTNQGKTIRHQSTNVSQTKRIVTNKK
jgi:hypothetical protein